MNYDNHERQTERSGEVLDVGGGDLCAGEDDEALHHVAQLADIARPVACLKRGDGIAAERLDSPPLFLAYL